MGILFYGADLLYRSDKVIGFILDKKETNNIEVKTELINGNTLLQINYNNKSKRILVYMNTGEYEVRTSIADDPYLGTIDREYREFEPSKDGYSMAKSFCKEF